MRYIDNGIEIQYRECQILRDTAKEVLQEKNLENGLAQHKSDWLTKLKVLSENNERKRTYAAPASVFLGNLSDDMYEAVSEYVESLVAKGKGIDIMTPYVTGNGKIILPVNTHAAREVDYGGDLERTE